MVKIKEEEKEEYKNTINPRGVFPYLVTEEGGLGESLAIARFMCNSTPECTIYGSTPQEKSEIDEIIEKSFALMTTCFGGVYGPLLGYFPTTDEKFKADMKKFKDHLRSLDSLVKDKEFAYGDSLTIADIFLIVHLNQALATVIDAGFRKAIPNLTAWYEKLRSNELFMTALGKPIFCSKPGKPMIK